MNVPDFYFLIVSRSTSGSFARTLHHIYFLLSHYPPPLLSPLVSLVGRYPTRPCSQYHLNAPLSVSTAPQRHPFPLPLPAQRPQSHTRAILHSVLGSKKLSFRLPLKDASAWCIFCNCPGITSSMGLHVLLMRTMTPQWEPMWGYHPTCTVLWLCVSTARLLGCLKRAAAAGLTIEIALKQKECASLFPSGGRYKSGL